jgi:heme-degrading monooxygenase HmoA
MIAKTPPPPYYAVIFSSLRSEVDEGYDAMTSLMKELAAQQPGFLGLETARDGLGITVSYWATAESITAWKANLKHAAAQRLGREKWYEAYTVRICLVERDYAL